MVYCGQMEFSQPVIENKTRKVAVKSVGIVLEMQECETVTTHHASPLYTTSSKQLLFYSKQHDQGSGSKSPYITTSSPFFNNNHDYTKSF